MTATRICECGNQIFEWLASNIVKWRYPIFFMNKNKYVSKTSSNCSFNTYPMSKLFCCSNITRKYPQYCVFFFNENDIQYFDTTLTIRYVVWIKVPYTFGDIKDAKQNSSSFGDSCICACAYDLRVFVCPPENNL